MPAIPSGHGDEGHDHADRVHSEAPAEGDPEFDETETRAHSMEPAEGADDD